MMLVVTRRWTSMLAAAGAAARHKVHHRGGGPGFGRLGVLIAIAASFAHERGTGIEPRMGPPTEPQGGAAGRRPCPIQVAPGRSAVPPIEFNQVR
jgi:hypothetical protein